ncbi:MAG: FeoB-associated Cys-rich membrane protein [Paludibacter sp.]
MLQDIPVLLIIIAAVAYTIYSIVKAVTSKDNSCMDNCMSGCDIQREITKKQRTLKNPTRRWRSHKPLRRQSPYADERYPKKQE